MSRAAKFTEKEIQGQGIKDEIRQEEHLINGRVYGNCTFNYKLYENNYLKMNWKMRGRNLACPIFRLGSSIFHEGLRKPTKDFNTGQQRFESCTPRIRYSRTN